MAGQLPPVKVFYSYAHEDEKYRRELDKALAGLRRRSLIEVWDDRRLVAGDRWEPEIFRQLDNADIILLLVSSDFVDSDFATGKEMARALERYQAGEALVIPVMIRSVFWKGLPFENLQVVPDGAKPIDEAQNRDAAWANVAEQIELAVGKWRRTRTASAESMGVSTTHRRGLPRPLTRLIGRDDERAKISQRLFDGDVPLLTITGAPGVGKSLLGLYAARDVAAASGWSVFRVGLTTLETSKLVAAEIARAVGVADTTGDTLLLQLQDFFGEGSTLLLLDGFERVLSAGAILPDLLEACPGLTVCVTSRSRLGVPGESEHLLEPLPVPDRGAVLSVPTLLTNPSVALFVDRARAAKSDFELLESNAGAVVELCIRTGGLPIALQLVASYIRDISPNVILEKLPALANELEELVASSLTRLGESEQQLFDQISAFPGGCTLESAEAVATSEGTFAVLSSLRVLLAESLLHARPAHSEYRYSMLEPIRQVAIPRLESSGGLRDHTRLEQARYFLKVVEEAEPKTEGPDQLDCLARLDTEYQNYRAVLGASGTEPVPLDVGLRVAGALGPFWYARGLFGEGREWLRQLFSNRDVDTVHPAIRAKALNLAGILTYHQSDHPEATEFLQEALELFEALDVKDEKTASLLKELHFLSRDEGRAKCLNGLAFVAKEQGEYDRSADLYQQSLNLYRQVGDQWGIAWTAADYALVLLYTGDPERSVDLLRESLQIQGKELQRGVAIAKLYLAYAEQSLGHSDAARRLADESLRQSHDLQYRRGSALGLHFVGYLHYVSRDDQAAWEALTESKAIRKQQGDRIGMAECLCALALIMRRRGEDAQAVRLFDEAEQLRGNAVPVQHAEYALLESDLRKALIQLGRS